MAEAGKINSGLDYFGGHSSHGQHRAPPILVLLHPFIDVVRNYAPCLCSDSKQIVKLSSLGYHAPVDLCLASAKDIDLEITAQIIDCIHLHIPGHNA